MKLRFHLTCLLLGGLAILAACAPLAPALTPTAEPPTASPTSVPSPTATIDWFPATETPTPLPTPLRTPTPELRSGLGPVILEDDFSAKSGWEVGKSAGGSAAYGQAGLTLAVAEPKGAVTSRREDPKLGDAYLEVSAEPSLCRGEDSYGLLLRAGDSTAYRLILTCGGRLRLERWRSQEVAVVQDWTPRLGPPAPTRFGIWMRGPEIHVFIDDVYQFSVTDPVLASGSVGVFARAAGDTALSVTFSGLVVRSLSGASTAVPTGMPAGATPAP